MYKGNCVVVFDFLEISGVFDGPSYLSRVKITYAL